MNVLIIKDENGEVTNVCELDTSTNIWDAANSNQVSELFQKCQRFHPNKKLCWSVHTVWRTESKHMAVIKSDLTSYDVDPNNVIDALQVIKCRGKSFLPDGSSTNNLGVYYDKVIKLTRNNKEDAFEIKETK